MQLFFLVITKVDYKTSKNPLREEGGGGFGCDFFLLLSMRKSGNGFLLFTFTHKGVRILNGMRQRVSAVAFYSKFLPRHTTRPLEFQWVRAGSANRKVPFAF